MFNVSLRLSKRPLILQKSPPPGVDPSSRLYNKEEDDEGPIDRQNGRNHKAGNEEGLSQQLRNLSAHIFSLRAQEVLKEGAILLSRDQVLSFNEGETLNGL